MVGDLMVDVAVRLEALARGGDVHGEVRIRPGGSGANAAVWAAHGGARTRLYGSVGDDLTGRLLLSALRERGVEPVVTVDPGARTGSMLVVREGNERSMVADRGANSRLTPDALPERLWAGAVLVSGYLLLDGVAEPGAIAALRRADARYVAVDAASWPLLQAYGAERFLRATAGANLLFANEEEADVLAQGRDHSRLAGRYEQVWIKRGSHGAACTAGGVTHRVAGSGRNPVDTTGAGDAFDGTVLAGLSRGQGPGEALFEAASAGGTVAMSEETWPAR